MAEGEFRYLTPHAGEGVIHAALLPSDNLYNNQDRKLASWQHKYRPSTGNLAVMLIMFLLYRFRR